MKAMVVHEYGPPEVLKLEDVPRPLPKENEVLVRVIASGVNPVDTLIVSGKYAKEFGTHLPLTPGYDIAGVIEQTGAKITKLKPVGGFCAETAGAITLFMASSMGIPVSTTHTITGAIVGVGSTHRISAVRWGVAGKIVWAWILTIPASALVAAVAFWIIRFFHPGA